MKFCEDREIDRIGLNKPERNEWNQPASRSSTPTREPPRSRWSAASDRAGSPVPAGVDWKKEDKPPQLLDDTRGLRRSVGGEGGEGHRSFTGRGQRRPPAPPFAAFWPIPTSRRRGAASPSASERTTTMPVVRCARCVVSVALLATACTSDHDLIHHSVDRGDGRGRTLIDRERTDVGVAVTVDSLVNDVAPERSTLAVRRREFRSQCGGASHADEATWKLFVFRRAPMQAFTPAIWGSRAAPEDRLHGGPAPAARPLSR